MSYSHNPNLYQWKRFTKRRDEEKNESKKKDIYDDEWMKKKIETASQKAMKIAFHNDVDYGVKTSYNFDKENNIDDEYTEANQLLTEWMGTKLHEEYLGNEDHSMKFGQDQLSKPKVNEWYNDSDAFMQHCLKVTDFGSESSSSYSVPEKKLDLINLDHISEMDESEAASEITRKLMEKTIVNMKALKTSKKPVKVKTDPAKMMEMRHKAVKETMEKRRLAEKQKQAEKMQLEETRRKAKEMVMKEEQKRMLKIKKEEDAIKREMVRLRKEYAFQREQKKIIDKQDEVKHKTIHANNKHKVQEILTSSKNPESVNHNMHIAIDKEKQAMNINIFRLKRRKRTLQNYFTLWYKEVLTSKMKLGKAKAMSDWRILLKAWNIWKKCLQHKQLEQAAYKHSQEVRHIKQSEKMAKDSNRMRILKRSFLAWNLWTKAEMEKREISEQKEITKSKMQALMDKVIHSKLEKNDITLESIDSEEDVKLSPERNKKDVDRMFKTNEKPAVHIRHAKLSAKKPKSAWQVSKDHVYNLTKNEMEDLSGKGDRSFVPRSCQHNTHDPYKNRHKFQREMMEEQKQMIHEQKRMIEDLKQERRLLALNNEVQQFQNENPKKAKSFLSATSRGSNPPSSANIHSPRNKTVELKAKSAHPLVTAMEKRAQERAKKHQELMERKRQKEQEKLEEIQRLELECQKQEDENQRLLKEEKRKEKELKIQQEKEKQAFLERMKMLNRQAGEYYKKYLMKKYGMRPLKRLVASSRAKNEVAMCHYNDKLSQNVFNAWRTETVESKLQRNEIAVLGHNKMLLKRALQHWKMYGEHMEILEKKADMHYNRTIQYNYIKVWMRFTTNEKLQEWDNEAKAKEHNTMRMKKRVFVIISSYFKNIKKMKERDERMLQLRQRVTRLLPDYQPDLSQSYNNDSEDEN